MSRSSWWASKVRQFRMHLRASVASEERSELVMWLTPAQLALFDSMHVADRRHGLDVVAALRRGAVGDREVLLAGLLHDAGKGNLGVWSRVAYSLAREYGGWVRRMASVLPGFARAIERLERHAEVSAILAQGAGCSPRTVALIRAQDAPTDPEFGELLRLADEAN